MPSIWKAPSPTKQMTGRPGCANFAAIAYGTPGTIVASVPESEARFPLRSFSWRAYQFVDEPESAVMIASSGSTCESSCTTRCGFIGSASIIERRSTMSHQSRALSSICPPPPPPSLPRGGGAAPPAVLLAEEVRLERLKRLLRVADQLHVGGVAHADHVGLDVDLDAPRLP